MSEMFYNLRNYRNDVDYSGRKIGLIKSILSRLTAKEGKRYKLLKALDAWNLGLKLDGNTRVYTIGIVADEYYHNIIYITATYHTRPPINVYPNHHCPMSFTNTSCFKNYQGSSVDNYIFYSKVMICKLGQSYPDPLAIIHPKFSK